jgi:hypothetical protein
LAQLHRDLIISLAARHKLPAVYFERAFVVRFFHAREDADNESGVIAERRRWRGVILSPAGPVRLPRSLAQARIGPGPIFLFTDGDLSAGPG